MPDGLLLDSLFKRGSRAEKSNIIAFTYLWRNTTKRWNQTSAMKKKNINHKIEGFLNLNFHGPS